MFACGAYPCFPDFKASVAQEARDQIKRLRHHPCLVLWAGNNEDYQIAEAFNLDWDPADISGNWEKSNFRQSWYT